jgi:hypothetical protein
MIGSIEFFGSIVRLHKTTLNIRDIVVYMEMIQEFPRPYRAYLGPTTNACMLVQCVTKRGRHNVFVTSHIDKAKLESENINSM